MNNNNNNIENNNNNNTSNMNNNNNDYISNNNNLDSNKNNNNNDETIPDQNSNAQAAADVSTQTIYECQECNAQKLLKLKQREMMSSETQTDTANLHNETLCCLSNIRIPFVDTSVENSEMDQHYQKSESTDSSLEPEEALTPMTTFQPSILDAREPNGDQAEEGDESKNSYIETNL